jgi:hypothetical protein
MAAEAAPPATGNASRTCPVASRTARKPETTSFRCVAHHDEALEGVSDTPGSRTSAPVDAAAEATLSEARATTATAADSDWTGDKLDACGDETFCIRDRNCEDVRDGEETERASGRRDGSRSATRGVSIRVKGQYRFTHPEHY